MARTILCLMLIPSIMIAQGTWDADVRLTTLSAIQQTRIWDNGRNCSASVENGLVKG